MKILITGGAGFIGFNLLTYLHERYPEYQLTALDNLKRSGSETNVLQLAKRGIKFLHGDIRNPLEIRGVGEANVIIHCASDASVLSGINSPSALVIQNNLIGSINIFEFAVEQNATLIFFSTNRVYSCQLLNEINFTEAETRFCMSEDQDLPGASPEGISEFFSPGLSKTFYGATKFCCEQLLQEYAAYRGLKYVINRFGVVSGKGQFGMQDQGIISYWLKQHISQGQLTYFGYGGRGKQVRDALHVSDLCRLIELQLKNLEVVNWQTFNIGGGRQNSFSLLELTKYCEELTGNSLAIQKKLENREGDIPIYYTDNRKAIDQLNWEPQFGLHDILGDLISWYKEN